MASLHFLLQPPSNSNLLNLRYKSRPVRCANERQALFNRIAPVYDNVRLPPHSHLSSNFRFLFLSEFSFSVWFFISWLHSAEWFIEFGAAPGMEKNGGFVERVITVSFFSLNYWFIPLFSKFRVCKSGSEPRAETMSWICVAEVGIWHFYSPKESGLMARFFPFPLLWVGIK